ncbi:DNA/RNA-binding protein KIN17-like isoform X2 [Mercenaria mercenaria]|uniref:DNA/RNA-binding protein KIN17-like isoform X2 n=1 Tax=Mercenaria mercenaria TaxID=6596 RepID=UPI00234E8FF6|nr:DNA/RNA-binding protein KIN17-like isoform X2 [Mercenaria mercenaria]
MGKEKGGFLTPKAIANRIKAKGLQKLRWYCQMCQKQCRDENGFKCHMMSESHQRQLLLFAENPDEYVDTFSKDFRDGYLELLRRRFGTKRVQCNIVYQEYISERDHTHMNSTQWETLTDFIKWLGKEGLCDVDYTEKGWFVKYIDRDPETIRKLEQMVVSLGAAKKVETVKPLPVENPFKKPFSKDEKGTSTDKPSTSQKDSKQSKAGDKRKSALDEIMEFEEQKKEKMNRKDYWLHEDIIVKVISKKLGDKYYKQKAYVKKVEDLYGGIIKMLDSGDKVKVDQSHLETVIPATGKTVLIVNGAYRGQAAKLESINEKKFSCTVSLSSGPLKGRLLENIPYEDICKIYQPS